MEEKSRKENTALERRAKEERKDNEDKQFRGRGRAKWPRVMGATGVSMETGLITELA